MSSRRERDNSPPDRDLALLVDYVSGELDAIHTEQVRERIESDEPFRRRATPLLAVLSQPGRESPVSADAANAALAARMAEVEMERWRLVAERRRRRWLAAPAVACAAAVLYLAASNLTPSARRLIQRALGAQVDVDLETAVGEDRSLLLPDGSRVTLEPETRLAYRPSFFTTDRVVAVRGAATFDVPTNQFGSFRVAAGRVFVEALNARFSVRAYSGDQASSVVVSRGHVSVSGSDRHIVNVDSGYVARVAGSSAEVKPIDADGTWSWNDQQLRFDRVTLGQVAKELRHWYGVEIRPADATIASRLVTATIPTVQSQGIAVLCAAANVRAERGKDVIVLYDAGRR